MSFDNRVARIGKTEYKASAADALDLPRKYLYRDLILNVDGSLTITTAGSPVLKAGGMGSALKMVKRVEVIANGRDTIKSISADAIAAKNMFLFGSKPKLTETGITAATHAFGGIIHLPFSMPRTIREIDTLLNSGKLSTLELRVTYGADDEMFATAPTTFSIVKVDVIAHYNFGIRLDGKDEPYSAYKEAYIEKDVVAASSEFQILLSVGNRYRGFLIECESDGDMVDTIINKVTIKSGTDIYKAIEWAELQEDNRKKFGLQAQTFVGYGYIDHCPEGRLVDALDASNLSSLEMILDVAHPGTTDKVRVYPCEIVPPMPV